MALVKAETVTGFQRLPALRQLGLMIGLAASVALGVSVVLWSQTPSYTLLYGNLSSADAGKVIDALQKSGIEFKVDQASGAVMVPNRKLHTARMELAKDGLPQGSAMGFELLQQEQGLGTSEFIEKARYQRALEGELSRTISALRNIRTARVHLAIPKRSVFLRNRSKPTASVMTDLYSGRSLDEAQVAAIIHLVSSSVPHLEPGGVTVVDQHGNLLSNGASSESVAATSSQFSYNRKLESSYTDRIRELLEPIVGRGKVRATVSADLDFTVTERTQETYNPDLPALRSEQISEDLSSSNSATADASGANTGAGGGVPGALSNQPPEAGQLQGDSAQGSSATSEAASNRGNSRKRSVRNYELDKTISHTKLASGTIRRLSIAVVIDNKQVTDDKGKVTSTPWDAAELARFDSLIKEAVGFSAQRGDTLNINNSAFLPPPEVEPVPEMSLLEQPWLWDVLKQAGGALGLLLLVFGVLKPVLNSLAKHGAETAPGMLPAGVAADGSVQIGEDQVQLSGASQQPGQLQAPPQDSDQILQEAQSLVKEDPKRVAQVVKNWVAEDA